MWDDSNAVQLRAFLATTSGKLFLEELQDAEPGLTGTTLEAAALSSKESKGYRDCRDKINSLANFKSEKDDTQTYVPTEHLDSK